MKLAADVPIYMRPGHYFGRQGDTVAIIAYHGTVTIVEDLNGNRFPVKAQLVTANHVERKPDVEAVEDNGRYVKTKKQKAAVINQNQNTLF